MQCGLEDKEDKESTSTSYSLSMESAAYYSPGSGLKTPNINLPKVTTTAEGQSMKSESVDSSYKEAERGRTVEKNKTPNLSPSSMKVLEDRIIALKLEIETLNCQKGEHKQEYKGRHDEFHKRLKENSGSRLEYAFKEKEGEVFNGKIEESMDRVLNLEMEVDCLRSQNKDLLHQKEQELESLRIRNQELEFELSTKTKEASVSLELLESLTVKLQQKTENEAGLVEERDAFKQQVKDLEIRIESINDENRSSKYETEKQRTTISELQEKLQEKDGRILSLESEIESVKQDLSSKMESFEQKCKSLEIAEMELSELQEKLQEKDGQISTQKSEIEINKMELSELQEKLQEKDSQISTLESEIESVKRDLSNKMNSFEERYKSLEVDKMQLSKLQENLQEKDGKISTLELEVEVVSRDLSNKMKFLEQKYQSLAIDKMELEGKNDNLAASLEQRDMQVNKLNHEATSSFRSTVKKMGEMVDEFKKKSEDSVRILGRRIRVAEQLHNETREWYKKTQEKNDQDRKDNELAFHSIKIIMSMVSDTLSASEMFGLRFAECCEAITDRVSKVSCEINFVKDWMKRKNGALVQLKKDFDLLVVQLDDKENEIHRSRQNVLKLESKLRDLEKIVKEDDETMIVLKEEKREAIRQLCMWIDYHRGRSDFFKKAFFELVTECQRPG